MSGTIDELLMAAEYIMSEGNDNVILCERGIRTFETRTRNTFDLNAVPERGIRDRGGPGSRPRRSRCERPGP